MQQRPHDLQSPIFYLSVPLQRNFANCFSMALKMNELLLQYFLMINKNFNEKSKPQNYMYSVIQFMWNSKTWYYRTGTDLCSKCF